MSNRNQLFIYTLVVVWVALTTMTVRSFVFEASRCCERTLAGEVKWLDGPASAGQGGFEDLVWANTETGVKLRSAADIAAGDRWAPLIAPITGGEALRVLVDRDLFKVN